MRRSFKQRTFAALLAVLCATPAGAQQAPDPERSFAKAVELHQAGDILGAIENYEECLRHAPQRVDARSNLGAALARLGRFPEAIEQYRQALVTEPGHASVRFNLAVALYKTARIPEAAEELARVVKDEPPNKSALLLLADCHLQMGNDRRVIDLLGPVEALAGDDRAYAYLLGTALIRENELERGYVLIEKAMGTGESAETQLLLGAAHMKIQDQRGALEPLRKARELNPRLPMVHSLYGRALMATGDPDGAAQAFQRELDVNPNDFEANLYLGILRKDERRFDEAATYLKRAARMRPHDANILYSLGALHVARGEIAEGQQLLEKVVEQAPEFVQAHVLLATVYYRQKRKADGDRVRAIVDKLNAAAQAKAPGVAPR